MTTSSFLRETINVRGFRSKRLRIALNVLPKSGLLTIANNELGKLRRLLSIFKNSGPNSSFLALFRILRKPVEMFNPVASIICLHPRHILLLCIPPKPFHEKSGVLLMKGANTEATKGSGRGNHSPIHKLGNGLTPAPIQTEYKDLFQTIGDGAWGL